MTTSRRALTTALCTVFLLGGCGGALKLAGRRYAHSPLIPPLIDIVRSAGPEWAGHADLLTKLQSDGRLFVCEKIPGNNHAHATWGFVQSISVSEAFLRSDAWSADDKAEVLVIEACHVLYDTGQACHADGPRFRAALREARKETES